jgi:polyribonucleotide nucleotidyltransferase
MIKKVEMDFHGRPLSIEVGRLAKQADGAALVQYGETVLLVTAVAAKEVKMDMDFFPLTVDYQEKAFAAGKIPGGFFKREGRPFGKRDSYLPDPRSFNPSAVCRWTALRDANYCHGIIRR